MKRVLSFDDLKCLIAPLQGQALAAYLNVQFNAEILIAQHRLATAISV